MPEAPEILWTWLLTTPKETTGSTRPVWMRPQLIRQNPFTWLRIAKAVARATGRVLTLMFAEKKMVKGWNSARWMKHKPGDYCLLIPTWSLFLNGRVGRRSSHGDRGTWHTIRDWSSGMLRYELVAATRRTVSLIYDGVRGTKPSLCLVKRCDFHKTQVSAEVLSSRWSRPRRNHEQNISHGHLALFKKVIGKQAHGPNKWLRSYGFGLRFLKNTVWLGTPCLCLAMLCNVINKSRPSSACW